MLTEGLIIAIATVALSTIGIILKTYFSINNRIQALEQETKNLKKEVEESKQDLKKTHALHDTLIEKIFGIEKYQGEINVFLKENLNYLKENLKYLSTIIHDQSRDINKAEQDIKFLKQLFYNEQDSEVDK